MTTKTATRRAEGKSSEPGQEIVTVKKNSTTAGEKCQTKSGIPAELREKNQYLKVVVGILVMQQTTTSRSLW